MPFAFGQPSGFGRWISGDTSSLSVNAVAVSPGATAWEAEARFAGAGSLSALTAQSMQGAATWAGSGNLSVSARFLSQIAASFSGAGSSSASALLAQAALARFNGAGSLSVDATKLAVQISATFAGAGSFSANATLRMVAQASFAGAGAMSVLGQIALPAAATFQGTGALSAATLQRMAGYARPEGAGSLSVDTSVVTAGGQVHAGEARFAGAGNLSVAAGLVQQIGARFDGVGGLSCHGISLTPLIPDGDSSTGGWLTEVDSLPLYPSLDEMVPLDADYIKSSPAPAVDICKISLSNPTTGTLVAPVSVLYRYGKSGTDTAQLQVRLLQGSSMIAIWQHNDIAAGFVTVEQFLTEGMIGNITDWNDLFLEFRSGTITTHMGRATFNGAGAMSSSTTTTLAGRATLNGIGAMSMSSSVSSGDTIAPSVPGGVLAGGGL